MDVFVLEEVALTDTEEKLKDDELLGENVWTYLVAMTVCLGGYASPIPNQCRSNNVKVAGGIFNSVCRGDCKLPGETRVMTSSR